MTRFANPRAQAGQYLGFITGAVPAASEVAVPAAAPKKTVKRRVWVGRRTVKKKKKKQKKGPSSEPAE